MQILLTRDTHDGGKQQRGLDKPRDEGDAGRLKAEALQASFSCKDAFSLGSLDSVLIL